MHLAHAGQIVCVERCHHELGEEACASMKQGQQMRNGKATAWLLFRWLTELLLQNGRIGHGAARAIDEEGAMPMPATFL